MSMQYSGDNVTFPDGSVQNTAPNGTGFKNRIINGAMMIDQRNAGASVTPTDGQYTLDRWQAGLTQSSKFSVQQIASALSGFSASLKVTSLSSYSIGSGDIFALAQKIEGFNVADFGWGTSNAQAVTLSFKVQSSLTGTFGGSIRNSATDRSYPFVYTISAANTWETKTVTIAGDTSGTWLTTNGIGLWLSFGLGCGSTYSGTAGAWATGNYPTATGATSVVGTNGATFYITGVQLEKGSTATSFDYRPYGTELALCYRYYWKFNTYDAVNTSYIGIVGFNDSSTGNFCVQQFPVTMRSAPSFTTTGVGANYEIRGTGTSISTCSAAPTINNYGTQGCDIRGTTSGGLTGGNCTVLRGAATTAFWSFSAEL